jgi:single-strand DNA-binding protein
MYANLTICGRLTRDPEIKYTNKGEAYARLSVACDGGRKDETLFVSVTVFGKSAEACASYLAKGRTILCSGQPSAYGYISKKDGQAKGEMQMVAGTIKFVDSQKKSNEQHSDSDDGGFSTLASDDDLPF